MSVLDALGAVGTLGSVAANLVSNSQNVKLAREQREHDLRMWNLNNEYNAPAAQVRRLRDAGLNPGIAMMNGSMSSGNSQQTAGGQTPATVDYNPLAEGLRGSFEMFSQREKTKAEIRNMDANTNATNIRNKTQLLRDLADLNEVISRTGNNNASKEYLIKQRDLLQKQIDAFDERNAAEVKRTQNEAKLLSVQEESIRVSTRLNELLADQEIRLSKSQQAKLAAETKNIIEATEQMKMNGASQREINSFIRDKEREIARQYHLENTNWYNTYKTKIEREKAETRRSNTSSIFGIPFDISSSWQVGTAYFPGY